VEGGGWWEERGGRREEGRVEAGEHGKKRPRSGKEKERI
jgi:hypothetical protein